MSDVITFYDELADYYHLIFEDWEASRERQSHALDSLIRQTAGPNVETVLDCACGIGTQALGLAALGYRVTATDISPNAVDQTRNSAISMRLQLSYEVADYRTLAQQIPGDFDIVLASGNALAHILTEGEMLTTARQLFGRTTPGGQVIISIRDYDEILQSPPKVTPVRVFDTEAGRRVYFQVWDWVPGMEEYHLQLYLITSDTNQDWHTKVLSSHLRAWRREPLSEIFNKAGFADVLWHMPAETDHHSPILTGRRPTA